MEASIAATLYIKNRPKISPGMARPLRDLFEHEYGMNIAMVPAPAVDRSERDGHETEIPSQV